MEETRAAPQRTGVMIPVCVRVSRKTGKVTAVDRIDGTPEEVVRFAQALKKIGKIASEMR